MCGNEEDQLVHLESHLDWVRVSYCELRGVGLVSCFDRIFRQITEEEHQKWRKLNEIDYMLLEIEHEK